jgi:heme-degrading monooxygenase HmoA
MMTVITEVEIEAGQEPQWDRAFHERFGEAPKQPGWVGVQLLIPVDAPNKRVVVGTWQSRADWEAWHSMPAFQRTRKAMDGVQQAGGQERWYEVVHQASGESVPS